jgi:putative membrane protein
LLTDFRNDWSTTMQWNDHWHNGMGSGFWLVSASMMVLFWGAVAWVVVTLVRRNPSTSSPASPGKPTPEHILHERFARGEIDAEEYEHRLATLRAASRADT